jgi:hypothetical protein
MRIRGRLRLRMRKWRIKKVEVVTAGLPEKEGIPSNANSLLI